MFSRCVWFAGLGVCALNAASSGQMVVACFDVPRGGTLSVSGGANAATLRTSILNGFAGTTFRPLATLTQAGLAGADVVILSSAMAGTAAITPLTAAEQAALSDFVLNGGGALLFTDNDTFAGAASAPANQSLIVQFGMTPTGTGSPWPVTATVPNPAGSPVTAGPFGTVTAYTVGWSGWYSAVPAGGSVIAGFPVGTRDAAVVIARGSLGPCSGAVVGFSDSTMIFDGYFLAGSANDTLVRNAIAFARRAACGCYANCDGSTISPVLNVNDFQCFMNRYAAGDSYANCDASTIAPVLNVNDFQCFMNRYAAGCP